MELDNYQSIITKYNIDEHGNPISITKEEEQQVNPLKNIVETGIIDELQGFEILNKTMYQVYNMDELTSADKYYVDYKNGRVYFHNSLKGSAIRYKYGDRGNSLISATRIFTALDENGNVVELLHELINLTREYIAILGTFEQATIVIKKLEQDIKTGNKLHENLTNDISEGGILHTNLTSDISAASDIKSKLEPVIVEANDINTELSGVVSRGEILHPQLSQTVTDAEFMKTELDQSITNAQDDIATIKATGNAEIIVLSSEWTLNGDIYEKELTHDLNSENLHITCKNRDTKEAMTIGYKILNKTRILLKSDVAENVSIVLSGAYYKATMTISDNIAEETVKAREGKTDLLQNMIRKANYKSFNRNSL